MAVVFKQPSHRFQHQTNTTREVNMGTDEVCPAPFIHQLGLPRAKNVK